VKLFIPHDAISIEETGNELSGRKPLNGKNFRALCAGSFFTGPNLVVKLSLPASEHISTEHGFMEIITSPRTKMPPPGSMVDLSVDERLLRFVKAESE